MQLVYKNNHGDREIMKCPGNTDAEKTLIKAYIVVEAVILIVIQAAVLMRSEHQTLYMYSAIVVNTAMTAYFYARYGRSLRDRHDNLIAYALFMTLVADWFLTFADAEYEGMTYTYGLIAFCTVEILYAAYLRVGPASIIVRALLYAMGLFGLSRGGLLTAEPALGLLNMVLIMMNVIDAWAAKRKETALIFKIGITLFFCCDVTVMLSVLTSGSASEAIRFMTWIFYVPAQVLLTLSYVEACTGKDLKDQE